MDEKEKRDLAGAYSVGMWCGKLYEDKYGAKHVLTRTARKRGEQHARNILGDEYELAKRCYKELYGEEA